MGERWVQGHETGAEARDSAKKLLFLPHHIQMQEASWFWFPIHRFHSLSLMCNVLQFLTTPLDGFDGDSNYGMLSGMNRCTNGVEVKASNRGTYYVTGSPSRSSSTSPPQSDIGDISSILQFIATTGTPSYAAVSPAGSFASNNGVINSMANQYLYQPGAMQYQQQQPRMQPETPKKLQRPKSANVPLTKDVVRDLQQQASRFLEEQCQQYMQQQGQDHCLQQHLQRQHQLQQQQQEIEQQLQQHQNLFIGSQHQDPFLPSHFFGGNLFQQPQQQHLQTAVPQQSLSGNNNNATTKPNFQFSSSQGQHSQAYQGATQTYQPLPPYTSVPNMTNNSQVTVTKTTTSIPGQSTQSSGNSSLSYVAVPPPLPLPPQGFTLNPVSNGRPSLQRQGSGGHASHKLKPQQNVQPQLKVKPLAAGNQTQQQVVTNPREQVQQQQKQEQQQQLQDYRPPPQYPGVVASITPQAVSQQPQIGGEQQQRELRRSFEMLERMQNLTLSQPDLTKLLEKQQDVPKLLALSKTDLDLPIKSHLVPTTPVGSPQRQEVPPEQTHQPQQQQQQQQELLMEIQEVPCKQPLKQSVQQSVHSPPTVNEQR